MTILVNTEELEAKVKDMYRHVAQQPQDRFHFELGAPVALRAGYDAERIVDPGSGSGEFIPDQARNASATYGVKSISVLASKTER